MLSVRGSILGRRIEKSTIMVSINLADFFQRTDDSLFCQNCVMVKNCFRGELPILPEHLHHPDQLDLRMHPRRSGFELLRTLPARPDLHQSRPRDVEVGFLDIWTMHLKLGYLLLLNSSSQVLKNLIWASLRWLKKTQCYQLHLESNLWPTALILRLLDLSTKITDPISKLKFIAIWPDRSKDLT